jgi:hypothetical protein
MSGVYKVQEFLGKAGLTFLCLARISLGTFYFYKDLLRKHPSNLPTGMIGGLRRCKMCISLLAGLIFLSMDPAKWTHVFGYERQEA